MVLHALLTREALKNGVRIEDELDEFDEGDEGEQDLEQNFTCGGWCWFGRKPAPMPSVCLAQVLAGIPPL